MSFKELDRDLEEVIIVDLLSERERQDHEISSSIRKHLAANGINQLQLDCSTKEHVFEALRLARKRAESKSFLIHFTAHGYEDGIGNKVGMETIFWDELSQPLAEINTALNGGLILNMVACKGLHALKIDNLLVSEIPYYALVGPTKSLSFQEAGTISISFYSKLLSGIPIPTIVKEIIDEYGEVVLWTESSQARRGISQ